MPSGIVMVSASEGATKEAIEAAFEKNGLEVDRADTEAPTEPQRDTFASDEEFEAAHEEWKAAREQPEAKGAADTEEEREQREEQQRKPSRVQRKIDRATKELQKELAETKARLAALEGTNPKEESEADKNPRPKRADFEDNETYEDALLAWGTHKALSERAMREAQESQEAQLKENYDNYRAQVEEFKDTHDDWDDTVNQELPMHTGVQLAIMEQENGAEVIYYLGKHPDYTKKLAEMSPLSAVMEVGRLSARLKTGAPGSGEANGGANGKPRPRVPAPVQPVGSSVTSSSLTSREIAAKAPYDGQLRDFKAAQRAGR